MKKKNYIIGGIILIFLYLLFKIKKRTTTNLSSNLLDLPDDEQVIMDGDGFTSARLGQINTRSKGQCVNPEFKNYDISGRSCAGNVINENKVLKLGDNSCEVLLLQQRLNNLERTNILEPNGQFCCKCKSKLMRVMSKTTIALNQFSPDEQIGFNELEGGKKITPYSYMDANYIKKR